MKQKLFISRIRNNHRLRDSRNLPPAEQAAAYYEELLQRARESIVAKGTLRLADNLIECSYAAYSDFMATDHMDFVVVLKINGKEHKFKRPISYDQVMLGPRDKRINSIAKDQVQAVVLEYIIEDLRKEIVEKIIGRELR